MANLGQIVYLSEEDKKTLFDTGTVTAKGQTVEYSDNDLYITPKVESSGATPKNLKFSSVLPMTNIDESAMYFIPNLGVQIVPDFTASASRTSGDYWRVIITKKVDELGNATYYKILPYQQPYVSDNGQMTSYVRVMTTDNVNWSTATSASSDIDWDFNAHQSQYGINFKLSELDLSNVLFANFDITDADGNIYYSQDDNTLRMNGTSLGQVKVYKTYYRENSQWVELEDSDFSTFVDTTFKDYAVIKDSKKGSATTYSSDKIEKQFNNKLELIGTYTFAEDSATTTVWSRPSNADYLGLSEVYIVLDLKSNANSVTERPYLSCWDRVSNSRVLMCQLCPCWAPVQTSPASTMNRCIYHGMMRDGTMFPMTARYGNSRQYPYSINDNLAAQTYTLSKNTPYLNEIQVHCNNAGVGAGTTVKLWGVKYYE